MAENHHNVAVISVENALSLGNWTWNHRWQGLIYCATVMTSDGPCGHHIFQFSGPDANYTNLSFEQNNPTSLNPQIRINIKIPCNVQFTNQMQTCNSVKGLDFWKILLTANITKPINVPVTMIFNPLLPLHIELMELTMSDIKWSNIYQYHH
jgi:hypothetical protein